MNGTYFLENELFRLEGVFELPESIVEHLAAQAETTCQLHIARSLEPIFQGLSTDAMRRLCGSSFVCIRIFQPSTFMSLYPMIAEDSSNLDIEERAGAGLVVADTKSSEIVRSMKRLHVEIVRAAAVITSTTTGMTGMLRGGHEKAKLWLSNLNLLAERIRLMAGGDQTVLSFGLGELEHVRDSMTDVSSLLQKHCQKRWLPADSL
jgi:hypothetical protein